MRMRVAGALVAVACVTSFAATAQADTIGLSYLGTGTGTGSATIYYTGPGHDNGQTQFTRSASLRSLNYEVTSVSGLAANYLSVGTQLTVFCTDIFENAKSTDPTVDFGSVANSPNPHAPMGSDRAGLMSVLYALYHAGTVGHNNNTAAFQLAVWEIAHEEQFDATADSFAAAGLDVGTGDFYVDANVNRMADANTWLEAAWNEWRNGHNGITIMSAFGAGFQDVIIIVPLPTPVWMGLAGLAGVVLLRRRFT